jgi:hypothetical protein
MPPFSFDDYAIFIFAAIIHDAVITPIIYAFIISSIIYDFSLFSRFSRSDHEPLLFHAMPAKSYEDMLLMLQPPLI